MFGVLIDLFYFIFGGFGREKNAIFSRRQLNWIVLLFKSFHFFCPEFLRCLDVMQIFKNSFYRFNLSITSMMVSSPIFIFLLS